MSNKPKPICVVYLPNDYLEINKKFSYSDWMKAVSSYLKDEYHVFCCHTEGEFEIKVFFEKDFTEIQYEELKKIITEQIKK